MNPITRDVVYAVTLRLCFLVFGEWQDRNFRLKFTDVDYHVFTDAARHVAEGDSPFLRKTYRYSPTLAWLLVPNIVLHPAWGKACFIAGDIIAGYFIYRILSGKPHIRRRLLQTWLFNPFIIAISTRGSAESVVSVLVLGTLYFLLEKKYVASGVFYGLAVHFKIYPVIYCLPFYFAIENAAPKTNVLSTYLYPTVKRITFTTAAVISFLATTGVSFSLYGKEYIDEAFLYHVVRKDTKHNFSVYFYLLYLTADWKWKVLDIVTFLPQVVLFVAIAVKFYRRLPICLFLQTLVFVTFNKVCTSQYFIWYLTYVPLVVPYVKLTVRDGVKMVSVWLVMQALWLLPAYLLEFQNKNTFLYIWLASLGFFCTNVGIAAKIIKSLR